MADAQMPRQFRAVHRYARISARKVRLVASLIRGRNASEALDVLRFTHKRASAMMDKVLRSAMANADEQEANVSRLLSTAAIVRPESCRAPAGDRSSLATRHPAWKY